jgi:hypothetical protein
MSVSAISFALVEAQLAALYLKFVKLCMTSYMSNLCRLLHFHIVNVKQQLRKNSL